MDGASHRSEGTIARAKSVLRLRARAARRAVPPEARAAYARAIADRALTLPELVDAEAVAVYGASPEEADPAVLERALRARGVRVAYPRVAGPRMLTWHWVDDPSSLVAGAFGLREPASGAPVATIAGLDALIVPGIAFDASCNRLGYGGGYYDTLLATHQAPAIGIAFDEQLVDEVPHDERDRPVDVVVTPSRTFRAPTSLP